MRRPLSCLSILALGMLPALAFAHPGHDVPGFGSGLMHPLTGLDHLLAMLAVGWWSAANGARRVCLLPLCFALCMLGGAVLGLTGQLPVFSLDSWIAVSLIVLGGCMIARRSFALPAAAGIVGGIALLHGYAHGREMPASSATVAWLAGMLSATLILHLGGALIGVALRRQPRWTTAGGVGLAGMGLALLYGIAA